MKIAATESTQELKQWNDEIEEKITMADDNILRLKEWLEKTKEKTIGRSEKKSLITKGSFSKHV